MEDYKTVCNPTIEGVGDCKKIINGSHIEREKIWTKLNQVDFNNGDILTIGIFTEAKEGELIEWIPLMFGLEIKEWALFATYEVKSPRDMTSNL